MKKNANNPRGDAAGEGGDVKDYKMGANDGDGSS